MNFNEFMEWTLDQNPATNNTLKPQNKPTISRQFWQLIRKDEHHHCK